MKRTIPLLMGAAAILLGGCASQGDMDGVKRDLEEAKARLIRMERDVSGVRTEAKEEVARQLDGFRDELGSVRKLGADLQATLDASKVDSQVLSGKVEDLTLQVRKPVDDLALLREDTERRLVALDGRVAAIEKGMAELQKQVAEAKVKAEAPATPEAIYQKALETYRGGNMTRSREEFAAFLEKYPKHELAANAHYWLGESYYGERRYDQAVLAFQEVVQNFPAKEKAPAALLKQGMAFKELGDAKSARFVYRKLADEYPKTEEAAKAKEKLKELK